MSDPNVELEERAMAALRRRGTDVIDPSDGAVIGLQAEIKDLHIDTGLHYKLKVYQRGKPVALLVQTSGGISYFTKTRDYALEVLRREQVLDDLADV